MAYPLSMKNTFVSYLFVSIYILSLVSAYPEDSLAPAPAPGPGTEPDVLAPSPIFVNNPRLRRAYKGLQAIKKTIHSDPLKMTENWVGPNVCAYTGVTCVAALDDPSVQVVAGLDMNQADIAGYLPPELELLTELGFLHINSNRFCGIIPQGIKNLPILYELDFSNNRFVGPFPKAILEMPTLKYLDLRFNNFEGKLPPELFEKDLDAIFVNNNRFTGSIPETLGKSTASVVVLANNHLSGCIPTSIGNMPLLEQVLFSYNNLTGCLPEEIGQLKAIKVLDISDNKFVGDVPDSICNIPKLESLSFSNNYFVKAGAFCYSPVSGISINDTANCLVGLPDQKLESVCSPVVGIDGAIDCSQCRAPDDVSKSPQTAPVGQALPEPPVIESSPSPPTISYPPTPSPDSAPSNKEPNDNVAPAPAPTHFGHSSASTSYISASLHN